MQFSFWLRNWKRAASALRRKQTSPRQRPAFRPRLEALEDRTLPSVFNLLIDPATNPSGAVNELISDINAANQAGGTNTINLYAGGVYDLTAVNNTTNGVNGLPVIPGASVVKKVAVAADNLTIVGAGDTIQRDTAAPAFRLFDVAPGASLTLENVKLTGGEAYGTGGAADGGAIYNQGTLTLIKTTVQGNTAQGSNGAFGVGTNKKLINGQAGADAAGGGIWSSGSVTLQGATLLQGNSARGGQGGQGGVWRSSNGGLTYGNGGTGGGGFGGGLYEAGGSVTVTNSTLSANTAQGGTGGVAQGAASAAASAGAGGAGSGGGLYVAGGTLDVGDSQGKSVVAVESNKALGGAGGEGYYYALPGDGGEGSGGGIYIADAKKATLAYVDLKSNTAQGGTGGNDYVGSGNEQGPEGYGFGGGLYVAKGTVTMTNDTVNGNRAIGGDAHTTAAGGYTATNGGGIYILSGNVSLDSYTVANTTDNYDENSPYSNYWWLDNIDGPYKLI